MTKRQIEDYVNRRAAQMGIDIEVKETIENINYCPPIQMGLEVRAYFLIVQGKEKFIGCDYAPEHIRFFIDKILDDYMNDHKEVKNRYLNNMFLEEDFRKSFGYIKL